MKREDEETIYGLLKTAECPNCDGSGVLIREVEKTGTLWVDDGNGNPLPEPIPELDYEQEPCEWCYVRQQMMGKIYPEIELK